MAVTMETESFRAREFSRHLVTCVKAGAVWVRTGMFHLYLPLGDGAGTSERFGLLRIN